MTPFIYMLEDVWDLRLPYDTQLQILQVVLASRCRVMLLVDDDMKGTRCLQCGFQRTR